MREPNTLHQLLCSFHRFSPMYGDRLANHLPMAAVALWGLGADEVQIQRFARHYAARLVIRPVQTARGCLPTEPQPGVGRFEENLAYFSSAVESFGREAVLRRWIPRLMPGLVASAFHGLIRTAYAVESACIPELAHALAFWCAEYRHFAIPTTTVDRSARAVIEDVAAHFRDGDLPPLSRTK